MQVTHTTLLRYSLVVAATCLITGTTYAETLLSSFEQDLTTSVGLDWTVGTSGSAYTANGTTDGSSALALTHGGGWSTYLTLDGSEHAPLVAANNYMLFDITVPDTAEWRQVFVVMQGEGLGWTQRGGDVGLGATTTYALDLNESGAKAAAAGATWWQTLVIVQGGDAGGGDITTTFDNIRFATQLVPEPSTAVLALFGLVAAARRRR
ncbi:hypothetical protein MalM25_18410 [Planctomycetes bacterium MalM25]|nr:hypothetical protein MalM25_18410 [Planctomycetes bacterium MalM25]